MNNYIEIAKEKMNKAISNLSDRFTIEGATSSKGTYNLTYVSLPLQLS